ncbi:4Fe-4S dicluster domain-containing protein [Acidiphilium sp.]|uniref:4Fe-4S dicluster domain-containing protein n=1 Tax=Acidiphilium sp. TaxID=527 RepID=UPI0025908E07|nr:4Fe-4S dicluster domain-containing protein [Acidiphilium sp.]
MPAPASPPPDPSAAPVLLDRAGLQALVDALVARGFDVIGPTLRDGAIVYDRVARIEEFPVGWTDRQDAGRYRLERRADAALFGYAVGPQSWKRFLHPPEERLWRARRQDDGFTIEPEPPPRTPFAFLGVRACELHAIAIQDRVFLGGAHQDQGYAARRQGAFLVALNCGTAAGTCFCASMGTGPRAGSGFDLALTELIDATRHDFLAVPASAAGAALLAALPARPAGPEAIAAAEAVLARATAGMGRHLDTTGLKARLQANPEHPHWDEVAARCLACANCTLVCPTCFCTSVADHTNLTGTEATRVKRWDSCFTADFSFIHGGSVRASGKSRYRQWLTHKLAHWIDQFGSSGCVGCGRCIAWCPVGIDITAEAAAIGAMPGEEKEGEGGNA